MQESAYKAMQNMQDRHWWYKGRYEIIQAVLDQYLPGKNRSILDFGSGFGGMIPLLRNYGSVDAVEPNTEAWPHLKRKSARNIYTGINSMDNDSPRYNMVTMFDVIEHIEDDIETARLVYTKALSQEGFFVVTVPAYPWMWGVHDEINQHYRRYTSERLRSVLHAAGFSILRQTYFMSRLFPLAVAGRVISKLKPESNPGLKIPPKVINSALFSIFRGEAKALQSKDYPFGLSLLCIAQKSTN